MEPQETPRPHCTQWQLVILYSIQIHRHFYNLTFHSLYHFNLWYFCFILCPFSIVLLERKYITRNLYQAQLTQQVILIKVYTHLHIYHIHIMHQFFFFFFFSMHIIWVYVLDKYVCVLCWKYSELVYRRPAENARLKAIRERESRGWSQLKGEREGEGGS